MKKSAVKPPKCEVIPEVGDAEDRKGSFSDKDSAPLLVSSPMFRSPVEIPVPELPARKSSKHWVRTFTKIIIFILIILIILSFFAVSHQYLCLAVTGLPCSGCGPLPGLYCLLAAGLHYPCSQDECSHTEHCPPYGTRRCQHPHSGKGTWSFSEISSTCNWSAPLDHVEEALAVAAVYKWPM